jgi:hypothetical protein
LEEIDVSVFSTSFFRGGRENMRTAAFFLLLIGLSWFARSEGAVVVPAVRQNSLLSHTSFFAEFDMLFDDSSRIFVESKKCVDGQARIGWVAGVVNAPLDRVWQVVTDFRNYARWIPRCTRSAVVSPEILSAISDSGAFPSSLDISQYAVDCATPSETTLIYSEIDIIFPVGRVRSLLEIISDSTNFTIYWRRLASDITIYEGAWHIIPRGNRTLVICVMRYRLNVWLPPFMIHGAIRYYLPQMIRTLRQQVHREP